MGQINITNMDNIKHAAQLLKEVLISDLDDNGEEISEDRNLKFINFENLSAKAWRQRFKDRESPIIEFVGTSKYNQSYTNAIIYQCIEIVKKVEVKEISLLGKLKKLRLSLAKEERIPATMILSNKILADMVKFNVKTKKDFLNLNNVGPVTFRKYGTLFLKVLNEKGD